ncbi:MAG: hypothetical protein ACTSPV_12430 [Candidatus Hodarchaeales archaeon]
MMDDKNITVGTITDLKDFNTGEVFGILVIMNNNTSVALTIGSKFRIEEIKQNEISD